MNSLTAIVPIAAAAYVATNLDNFILLVSLLARYRNHKPQVVAAYFACALILGLIGFWIAMAASFAPVGYIGLLGVVPIFIGIVGVIRLRAETDEIVAADKTPVGGMRSVFGAVLISQFANGADTIITFGALFADSMPAADILILLTLATMAAIFVFAAIYSIGHPALSDWIDRWAHRVSPFILILVGFYILSNTATDLLSQ